MPKLDGDILFGVPANAQFCLIFAQRRQLFFELFQPAAARAVVFLSQRFALDLELHHASGDFVELLRHRIDLGPQLRRRFVNEIDRLVRQEAVGNVAIAHRRGRDQRGVFDAHAVVRFVLLFEAAQNRDRIFDARLFDQHRWEAPLERRILFDVLAVFVERRRADHVQLAACKHRFEQVARVHRAFGFARAHDGVQLVDEEDDLTFGGRNVLEHGFEALFEFAAVLRTGDQRAHVERDDALVLEAFRDVAADDALRESLDDRGLAHAGIADEHRIVLRSAREHLDDAPNLFVASDHRVEFAALRFQRKVATVTLERFVGSLGIFRRHALIAAHFAKRPQELIFR